MKKFFTTKHEKCYNLTARLTQNLFSYQIEYNSVQTLAIVVKENADEWFQTFGK